MLGAIRRWLNVKTWDQTHVPLELDPQEEDLRARLSSANLDPNAIEEYVELDRMIRTGEVDGVVAMTAFTQFCFAGGIPEGLSVLGGVPSTSRGIKEKFDVEWDVEKYVKDLKAKRAANPIEYKKPDRTGLPESYTFPPTTLRRGDLPLESEKWVNVSTSVDDQGEKVTRRYPMRPKSALYKPTKFTPDEEAAVKIVQEFTIASKYLDGLIPPKLKPSLKKKKADVDKGFRRVTIDNKGKIKEVKEPKPKAEA